MGNQHLQERISQVQEKLRIAILLSLGAGYMDGFTFFHFDGRFAGAQTGNIIQAGISLAQGNFAAFWDFFVPILFFIAGVMFKVYYAHRLTKKKQPSALYLMLFQLIGLTIFVLLYETVLSWVPNAYFVGILSFFMAIQFDTFNKTHGHGYTSVFTTGNLKILSVNLAQYLITREKKYWEYAKIMLFIVPCFFVGAFLATIAVKLFGNWALMLNSLDLLIVYIILRFEG
ncbi:YoaK family protein [Lactococcus nasutitermitis]|uniref:YoaK family protein n=1 Tax=Lactococcus nasutitermitis TaxID=1652957 RepID=A0ABV9JBZ7_9LACT|nr:YoaK family protein [Lactococcus nasutitermitis]